MATMPIEYNPLTQRSIQFMGISANKLTFKSINKQRHIVCGFPFMRYIYISLLIRFARVCSNIDDFNNRNLFLTAKLLKQGYRYHKIRKAFSKFYHRNSELIVKYNIGLKTLLKQGTSEPIFYGDLVYKFKIIIGKPTVALVINPKKDNQSLYKGWI